MFMTLLIILILLGAGIGGAYYLKYEPVTKFINGLIGKKEEASPSPAPVVVAAPAPAAVTPPPAAPQTGGQEGYTMTEYYRYK